MSVTEQARRRAIEIKQRRAKARQSRSFDAAITSRLTSTWRAGNLSADAELRGDIKTLRARSRDLYRNNDHMRRFVNLAVSNIVGSKGFTLQVRGKDRNTGEPDKAANDFLESDFADWAQDCDVTGKLTFRELCKLYVRQVFIDGEFLAIKVDGTTNADRFKLQILDPDQLDDTRNEQFGKNLIRMGVEVNAAGEPVAYHILQSHPNDLTYRTGGRIYQRIEASRVIHNFIIERPNQSRGIPQGVTAMMRLRNLKGYEEAEVINKRISASKMGFFERNNDGEGYEGEFEDDGSISMEAEPGVFETLPNGVTLNSFDPTSDGTSYADFVKSTLRGVASGLGVNYNTLANDLEGVNYSSIRAGVLEDRELWMALQEWMADVFLRPVYKHWLRNHLTFNSGMPATTYDKFKHHDWQPRRWAWVDPKKDIDAAVIAIDNGLKTRAQVIRESGLDPEQVWADLAAENAKLRELGVLVDATPAENSHSTSTEDE